MDVFSDTIYFAFTQTLDRIWWNLVRKGDIVTKFAIEVDTIEIHVWNYDNVCQVRIRHKFDGIL